MKHRRNQETTSNKHHCVLFESVAASAKTRSTSSIIKTQENRNTICLPQQRQRSTSPPPPPAMSFTSRRKSFLFGLVLITLTALLFSPVLHQPVEAAKTLKSLAKTLMFQKLTQRKHFIPLPVPIPVPIEINEKPIFLKGQPKYVNIYKPKPTPQPVTKPTTVYHMPIYSPTYEYMSMDPISSMIYSGQFGATGGGDSSYKSSVGNDADSTSSHSGVDYDDDTGNYYMRKAAARRNKLSASDYAYNFDLHRNDQQNEKNYDDHQVDDGVDSGKDANKQQDLAVSGSNIEEEDVDAPMLNDDESYDHENDETHHRMKRQVFYESGYNGNTNCEGFPLEINVRSRIKLDRIFPIHGKSQIKKCLKVKKSILSPVQDGY